MCSVSNKQLILHLLLVLPVMSREQGWRSGESTSLPLMWLGIDSRSRRNVWVEFVVGSLLCSKRVFSRYSGFPLPSKTNISKLLYFDPDFSGRIATLWRFHCKFLFYSNHNHSVVKQFDPFQIIVCFNLIFFAFSP